MSTKTTAPIIIPCLDELAHVEANNFQCGDPTCPCHDDTDDLAERLYIEQGMAQSRESLPWYGLPVLDTTHAPWCNCPECEPDEPDDYTLDGDDYPPYDEHPFI